MMLPGAMLLVTWFVAPRQRNAWLRLIRPVAAGAIAVLLLLNLGHLFQGTGRRLDSFNFTSQGMKSIAIVVPAMRLPLPAPMLEGADALNGELEKKPGAFILGDSYGGSVWYYYPAATLIKLPLATLLLVGGSLALMAGWIFLEEKPTSDEKAILAAALFYMLFSIVLGRVNLGFRYVLPMVPLLFLLTGRLWGPVAQRPFGIAVTRRQWAVLALLCAVALESLSVAPHFLAFANIIWGGPGQGYKSINDSSFDWGQGLLDLKRWMDDAGVKRVHLAYFGSVEPSVYGINYVPLSKESDDEFVAISTFFLAGLPQRLHTQEGVTDIASLENFRELQEKHPVAKLGWTIYIFHREDYVAAGRGL
jgi:hypothetical protein